MTSKGIKWLSRYAVLSATRIDFAKMTLQLDANIELPGVDLGLLEETFLKYDTDLSGYVQHPFTPTYLQMLCITKE